MIREMDGELIELVAARFKAFAEPARLRLLDALRGGEKSVTELMAETGLGQANVSKHLQLLHALGATARRKAGLHVYYRLTDPAVFRVCEIMCGRLVEESAARAALLARVGREE
jgi:DNA-binding transcriptional ArsR family regulator